MGKRKKVMKKCITLIIMLTLLTGIFSSCNNMEDASESNSQDELLEENTRADTLLEINLSNPVIESRDSLDDEIRVFYDCVTFGSYPQTEIVDKKSAAGAYDSQNEVLKWGNHGFQIEVNEELYNSLLKNEIWDLNNNTEIDNIRYKRLKKEDAILTYDDSNYFYEWDSNYHYFRYEPVKWRVLKVSDEELLLLSDVIIDASHAKDNLKDVNDILFSEEECNNLYDDSQGVFLLDKSQLCNSDYGFARNEDVDDEARKSCASMYAIARGNGVETHSNRIDCSEWWVNGKEDTFVNSGGSVYSYNYEERVSGLRPAIRLDKSVIHWKYAGSVDSSGRYYAENLIDKDWLNNTDQSSIPNFEQLVYNDHCFFGMFDKMGEEGYQEPIEWIVYEKNEQYIKLITKDAIDCRPYHYETKAITWEECSLREWLNNDFYEKAFSEEEKKYIVEESTPADENTKYPDLNPGNDTKDYVYILSVKEAEQISAEILACKASDYAKLRGSFEAEKSKNTWWWLRSPGDRQSNAAAIITDGTIDYEGNSAIPEFNNSSVRPSITIMY